MKIVFLYGNLPFLQHNSFLIPTSYDNEKSKNHRHQDGLLQRPDDTVRKPNRTRLRAERRPSFHRQRLATPWRTLISELISAYCSFNCLPLLPQVKIEKLLTNKEYAERYHADRLPDKKFTKLLLDCFNAKPKDKMPTITKLYNFVMKSGGGFDIGQFRGKRKIEKR